MCRLNLPGKYEFISARYVISKERGKTYNRSVVNSPEQNIKHVRLTPKIVYSVRTLYATFDTKFTTNDHSSFLFASFPLEYLSHFLGHLLRAIRKNDLEKKKQSNLYTIPK